MRMKSVMSHDFSKAPQALISRSSFRRSHGIKTTFDAGYLIPFYCDEVLPGDTHKLRATLFARFATLLFPIMDNVFIDTHFYYVPSRLVFANFQRMMGERDPDPDSSIDYQLPVVTSANTTDFDEGTIYDYFGLPTQLANISAQSLPFRAYNLIWNSWFRDENLQDSVVVSLADTDDDPADFTLLRRGKRYDYFTSCLPWPQKGDAVPLPLGTSAPVLGDGSSPSWTQGTDVRALHMSTGVTTPFWSLSGSISAPTATGTVVWQNPHLYADLSAATAATINDLREAFQIQRLQERDARGGTRYIEILRSHFGVISPDARLQRPELLSCHSTVLNVNAVAQTSGTGITSQTTPKASLSAYATATAVGDGFVHSFVEHGYIIGLISARADLTYQQGLDRMWSRSTRYDFYWPVFSHLGEQAVLLKELAATGVSGTDPGEDEYVFGYQEAWADYRYKKSMVTGLFRTNATGTLDSWHLSQDLSSPALNSDFIVENPPTTRVKATSGDPDFILDGYMDLVSVRPMPTYSVPGLIDHF